MNSTLSRLLSRLTVTGMALALAAFAFAQPSAGNATAGRDVGSIRGQVKNAGSGAYLNNARVSIMGTEIVEFTDATGSYRIANAPSGRVELEIYYTQMEPTRVAVDVPPNGQVERDVSLEPKYADAAGKGAIQLDRVVTTATRESDIEALAVNEQRFAPNIKNVVSTDAFGEVVGGTMGDFLKFIPGASVEYAGNTVTTGFGPRYRLWHDLAHDRRRADGVEHHGSNHRQLARVRHGHDRLQ